MIYLFIFLFYNLQEKKGQASELIGVIMETVADDRWIKKYEPCVVL